jgi:hypothetical protein
MIAVKVGGQENGLAWLVIAVIPLSCCSMAFRCLCVCVYVWFLSGAGNEELIYLSIHLSIHLSVRPFVSELIIQLIATRSTRTELL